MTSLRNFQTLIMSGQILQPVKYGVIIAQAAAGIQFVVQTLFNASTRLDNQSPAGSKLNQALLKIGILK